MTTKRFPVPMTFLASLLFLSWPMEIFVQAAENLPTTFFIELGGFVQTEGGVFVLYLTNGSKVPVRNLTMQFSVEKKDSTYKVHFGIESEAYSNDTLVEGIIGDSGLIIDSKQSIFIIASSMLKEGDIILLSELFDWKLIGEVGKLGRMTTNVPGRRIKVMPVRAFHFVDSERSRPLLLGFGFETGILASGAGCLSDILLVKTGIRYIRGGLYELTDYLSNLNFEFSYDSNPFRTSDILVAMPLVIFAVTTTITYYIKRRKERNQVQRHRPLSITRRII